MCSYNDLSLRLNDVMNRHLANYVFTMKELSNTRVGVYKMSKLQDNNIQTLTSISPHVHEPIDIKPRHLQCTFGTKVQNSQFL